MFRSWTGLDLEFFWCEITLEIDIPNLLFLNSKEWNFILGVRETGFLGSYPWNQRAIHNFEFDSFWNLLRSCNPCKSFHYLRQLNAGHLHVSHDFSWITWDQKAKLHMFQCYFVLLGHFSILNHRTGDHHESPKPWYNRVIILFFFFSTINAYWIFNARAVTGLGQKNWNMWTNLRINLI